MPPPVKLTLRRCVSAWIVNELDLGAFLIIAILIVVGIVGGAVILAPKANSSDINTFCSWEPSTFKCRDYQMQQCVASDKYTRDECIVLVGGGGK